MCFENEQPQAPTQLAYQAAASPSELMDQATLAQGKAFDQNLPRLGQYGQTVADIQKNLLPQVNQLNLEQKKIYGPALIGLALDMAKQADPNGMTLRDTLVSKVIQELGAGGGFSPQEQRMMADDYRQAQINRGFGTGNSDALDETAFMQAQRFNRNQARISNALNVLAGTNPSDKFMGSVNGIQQSGVPELGGMASNLLPSTSQLMSFGQNATAQNNSNIANANNMAFGIADWQNRNTSNPFKENLMFGINAASGLAGIAGSVAGGAMGVPQVGSSGMSNYGFPQAQGLNW